MIGEAHPRLGGERFVKGSGRFVEDVRVPGILHGAVLRSPHAHARLVSIDTKRARDLPGVQAVFTAADVPANAIIPNRVPAPKGTDRYLQPAIARDVVRFVGEPVALVVADDPYIARDALERIDVVYQPLPACASTAEALGPGAVRLFAGTDSNNVATITMRVGDTDTGARGGRARAARALLLPAADRGRPGNARPRRGAARSARRRAAPDRLDQVHPHQPDDPRAHLRDSARRPAPHRGGRGRGLRRARRALPGGHPGAARRHEARAAREVDREPPREPDGRQPCARGGLRDRDRLRPRRPHSRHPRGDPRRHRRLRPHRGAGPRRVRRRPAPRPLSRAELRVRSLVRRDQQDAGRHAALAGTPGVQLRARASSGSGRRASGDRPGGAPPAQPDPPGPDALRLRDQVVRREHRLRLR